MIQFVSFSNNMPYEDADDAEDVKAGSFYTTPNGTNTSFSFFREDDEQYLLKYPYIDITEDTAKLREFLQMRDNDPIFDLLRAHSGIGIPLFVKEDGTKTFDINEAFSWIGQEPVKEEEIVEHRDSCGINGCK